MTKDFSGWIDVAQALQNGPRPGEYNEGEVWWCALGCNIGSEEDGKGDTFSRPVLIVRGFNHELVWAVPLSTTPNEGPYYYSFELEPGSPSIALLSQLRAVDTTRLEDRVGTIQSKDLLGIRKQLAQILI